MKTLKEISPALIAVILLSAAVWFVTSETRTPNAALVKAGRDLKVKSLMTGKQNAVLQRAAEEHAAYQARVEVQGHQGFEKRVAQLRKLLPDYSEFSEVCNESWQGQSIEDAAKEMYNSWRKSPGHWSAVNGKCDYWGYAMVKGENGVWYACAIFAKVRK